MNMPVYDFVCEKCGEKQERLVRGERPLCKYCGGNLIKRLSVSGISAQYRADGFTKRVE